MDFSSQEQFELHVHKCFGKIFDGLMKIDAEVKSEAEKEESCGQYGVMCDIRDQLEEIILHCHLAWQYHRLSKAMAGSSRTTWDVIEKQNDDGHPDQSE